MRIKGIKGIKEDWPPLVVAFLRLLEDRLLVGGDLRAEFDSKLCLIYGQAPVYNRGEVRGRSGHSARDMLWCVVGEQRVKVRRESSWLRDQWDVVELGDPEAVGKVVWLLERELKSSKIVYDNFA